MTQHIPGWKYVVYKDGLRLSRHDTLNEATEEHGACVVMQTVDGWRVDPGMDGEYTIRLERHVRPSIWIAGQLARAILAPWDYWRRIRRPKKLR